MVRALLARSILLVLVATVPAAAQGGPPASRRASEIEALVNRAAEVLEARGRSAFAEFRVEGGPWRHGDVYLFVNDMQGVVLFNAAYPRREGRDMLEERDADGKQFHREFIHVARKYGSGWVEYMFAKPTQHAVTAKWSYVCSVTIDGVPAVVGAGLYAE